VPDLRLKWDGYGHKGVSEFVFRSLLRASSNGHFANDNIRVGYGYGYDEYA
jgi:hypothetical protein